MRINKKYGEDDEKINTNVNNIYMNVAKHQSKKNLHFNLNNNPNSNHSKNKNILVLF